MQIGPHFTVQSVAATRKRTCFICPKSWKLALNVRRTELVVTKLRPKIRFWRDSSNDFASRQIDMFLGKIYVLKNCELLWILCHVPKREFLIKNVFQTEINHFIVRECHEVLGYRSRWRYPFEPPFWADLCFIDRKKRSLKSHKTHVFVQYTSAEIKLVSRLLWSPKQVYFVWF